MDWLLTSEYHAKLWMWHHPAWLAVAVLSYPAAIGVMALYTWLYDKP